MQMVLADGDGLCLADYMPLISEQGKGCRDSDQRYAYAIFGVGGGSAATNPLNGAQGDAYRGYDNQDHLKKGYQRLRLAMTEAVIAIRGHGGEANAEQRHKAGGEIKRGIGERPKHRNRIRGPGAQALERQQEKAEGPSGKRRRG